MHGLARVLVVDDVVATRERLCGLFNEVPGVRSLGSGAGRQQIVQQLTSFRPHLVVVDVPGYDRSRWETVAMICQGTSDCAVIVMSNLPNDELRRASQALGVAHCLSKSRDLDRLMSLAASSGSATDFRSQVLLISDGDSADVAMIAEELIRARPDLRDVVQIPVGVEAQSALESQTVDLILLALTLPTATDSVEVLVGVRAYNDWTPIIVVTGDDDRNLALACIRAGAQDYVSKKELGGDRLRQAIDFALERARHRDGPRGRGTIRFLRELSVAMRPTSAFRVEADVSATRLDCKEWDEVVGDYVDVLLKEGSTRSSNTRAERIVARIGDAGGGALDLIEMHVLALERVMAGGDLRRSKAIRVAGGSLQLPFEMMGLLVDYYRNRSSRWGSWGARRQQDELFTNTGSKVEACGS